MMAGIRGSDTIPEKLIRSGLHRLGFRFRLHDRNLPGRPDLVFPSRRAVIEVRGCFWHGHDCHLFRWPRTREEFWRSKITANIERDERNRSALLDVGWRVAVVWECQMKGKSRLPQKEVLSELARFLQSDQQECFLGDHRTVSIPHGPPNNSQTKHHTKK
ncbi:very short patch repair endonuclease [Erythrobacter sp. Alg231-14]|uniref:very short patch repair endonuclease n=1 Tax=Erythrobacter sp. Alg231-14 TaxID=1922225 RepID=UPI00307B4A79